MRTQHWLLIGIVAVLLWACNDDDALARCGERMSREVCLHTLYR